MLRDNVVVGGKYDHLTVLSIKGNAGHEKSYLCRCDCGNEVVLARSHMLGTNNKYPHKSCGCMHDKQNRLSVDHPRLYFIYKDMIRRCYNEKATNYERYGANGTSVCDQWRYDVAEFIQWAFANGYSDSLELDRIDYLGNYCPENCRWVDEYTQSHNKGISKNNKTGVKGVCYSDKLGKYRAYIMRFGERLNLGSFLTLEEATAARLNAECQFHQM